MKYFTLSFIFAGIVILSSCSKANDYTASPETISQNNSDDGVSLKNKSNNYYVDLSIAYVKYKKGPIYKNDTIQTEFVITNHSNQTIKKGDTLKVSCDINGQEYDLWLQEPGGHSGLVLERDLHPKDTFLRNPGYLLGEMSREALKSDSLIVGLRVYGVNNAKIDYPKFSSDPNPINNRTEFVNTKNGTRITK